MRRGPMPSSEAAGPGPVARTAVPLVVPTARPGLAARGDRDNDRDSGVRPGARAAPAHRAPGAAAPAGGPGSKLPRSPARADWERGRMRCA